MKRLIDRFCHWYVARTINRNARHEDDPLADALSWANDLTFALGDCATNATHGECPIHAMYRALDEELSSPTSRAIGDDCES